MCGLNLIGTKTGGGMSSFAKIILIILTQVFMLIVSIVAGIAGALVNSIPLMMYGILATMGVIVLLLSTINHNIKRQKSEIMQEEEREK